MAAILSLLLLWLLLGETLRVLCIVEFELASPHVLPAGTRPWRGSASFHRDLWSSCRPVWSRTANSEHLSWLPDQVERWRHGQTVETTLVRARPCTALPAVLPRPDGEERRRCLHLVPNDPRRVCRPRAAVAQSASRVHVLCQDSRTTAVSYRPDAGNDAHMDRCNIHRRRGLSAIRLTRSTCCWR